MSPFEQTIAKNVRYEGCGLHSGTNCRVEIGPGEPGTGIVFFRMDLAPEKPIPATYQFVNVNKGQGRQTTLGLGDEGVLTVEHLLSALHGALIDNAVIRVWGNELPGLDGSSTEYYTRIVEAGIISQNKEREEISLSEPIYLSGKGWSLVAIPSDTFQVSYTLSYGGQGIEDQFAHFTVTPETYQHEIMQARTFCLRQEAELLQSMGYGKGASVENTLVFDGGKPIGNELRYNNEAARHKILDLIGDLYLLGHPIKAHIIAQRTGHGQNLSLVKEIVKQLSSNPSLAKLRRDAAMKKDLDVNDIQRIIPHRYPFLLVDLIKNLEPGIRAVGYKNVTVNEPCFQGHFPGHPIMPAVLMTEAMAQVGAVVMLSLPENVGKIAYFMSIDKAKFRSPVFPGDTMRMEVEVVKKRSRTGMCVGKTYVGDKLVCDAEVKFALVEA